MIYGHIHRSTSRNTESPIFLINGFISPNNLLMLSWMIFLLVFICSHVCSFPFICIYNLNFLFSVYKSLSHSFIRFIKSPYEIHLLLFPLSLSLSYLCMDTSLLLTQLSVIFAVINLLRNLIFNEAIDYFYQTRLSVIIFQFHVTI